MLAPIWRSLVCPPSIARGQRRRQGRIWTGASSTRRKRPSGRGRRMYGRVVRGIGIGSGLGVGSGPSAGTAYHAGLGAGAELGTGARSPSPYLQWPGFCWPWAWCYGFSKNKARCRGLAAWHPGSSVKTGYLSNLSHPSHPRQPNHPNHPSQPNQSSKANQPRKAIQPRHRSQNGKSRRKEPWRKQAPSAPPRGCHRLLRPQYQSQLTMTRPRSSMRDPRPTRNAG